MLVFRALVIVGVVRFIAWLIRRESAAIASFGPDSSRALEILQECYAKGEITREQYEQIRHDLEDRKLG
jgi:putative membrane protein